MAPGQSITAAAVVVARTAELTRVVAAELGHFSNIDANDFSWLASQNNFQFDPQLFGGYREPQDQVLSGTGLDDSFFNDAFDVDFTVPFNMPADQPTQKKDLIAEIDAAKEEDNNAVDLGANGGSELLTCNKIWYDHPGVRNFAARQAANLRDREKLQNCPKVQNGDFDLDGLCSDLQKKAKCSGSGAVVDEKDFQNVMKKYLGKDGVCTDGTGVRATD